MKLTFTKGAGKVDRLEITTETGPLAPIDCPKQGIIPHDMVHFAVESEVAAHGFLRLAADNADTGTRVGLADAHARSIERLVETFQAEAWDASPASDEDFIALYHITCTARGDTPLALDGPALAAIRRGIADLNTQWRAVPIGGSLTLFLAAPTPG